MGRVVNLGLTAGNTVSWTVDRDCAVVGFVATQPSVISRDRAIGYTVVNSPSNGTIDFSVIVFTLSAANMVIVPSIPLYAGEVIYLTGASTGWVSIYLIDSADKSAE